MIKFSLNFYLMAKKTQKLKIYFNSANFKLQYRVYFVVKIFALKYFVFEIYCVLFIYKK